MTLDTNAFVLMLFICCISIVVVISLMYASVTVAMKNAKRDIERLRSDIDRLRTRLDDITYNKIPDLRGEIHKNNTGEEKK